MGPGIRLATIGVLSCTLVGTNVIAMDIGIKARKLFVLDQIDDSGRAKVLFKTGSVLEVTKGVGTDVADISAVLDVVYTGTSGQFTVPAGASDGTTGWLVNKDTIAKFVNSDAPGGSTATRVAKIKTGIKRRSVTFDARWTGDAALLDIVAAGPPDAAGVTVVLTVTNGAETFRMCTLFRDDLGSSFVFKPVGPSGRKLIAKRGQPAACPP
jgi:hypothetical protein